MNTDQNRVRFIRKNGRIIPIRTSEKRKGVLALSSAAVIGGAGGYLSGLKLRKAESISQRTFDFMNDTPKSKLPPGVVDVHDGFMKARTKMRFAKKVAMGSRWVASGLAFYGMNKMMKNKDDSETKELAKLGAAAVASEVVTRGIYAGFKKKNPITMGFTKATKSTGLDIFKKIFKKAVL